MPVDFERLVEDYYRSAYWFAYSLTNNPEEASDLTQQAFYIAQTKLGQLREVGKAKAWLFTVLYREFLHTRRQVARHEQYEDELKTEEAPLTYVDHAALLDSKELLQGLMGLEEIFCVPLSLFYFEQLSYKEIAELLELPIGTVMSRLARGKQQLRAWLEQIPRKQMPPITKGGLEHE